MYKVLIQGNDYASYQYVETKTFRVIDTIPKTPLELKLFSNDVFDFDDCTGDHVLVHSNFKANKMSLGVKGSASKTLRRYSRLLVALISLPSGSNVNSSMPT